VNTIRQLRKAAGWSQHEVARAAGMTRSRISLIECGYVDATLSEKQLLKQVLLDAVVSRAEHLAELVVTVDGAGTCDA